MRSDTALAAGQTRDFEGSIAKLGGRKGQTLRVEARLVWTIEGFPFRGGEFSEPTTITMIEQNLKWDELPTCGSSRANRR